MISEFIDRWEKGGREYCRKVFTYRHPNEYSDIVKTVIKAIEVDEYAELSPDPERIYQGTLFFIIGEKGYQPSSGYYCPIRYDNCSGCDTLEEIVRYSGDKPTKQQTDDYVKLCSHVLQGLKILT